MLSSAAAVTSLVTFMPWATLKLLIAFANFDLCTGKTSLLSVFSMLPVVACGAAATVTCCTFSAGCAVAATGAAAKAVAEGVTAGAVATEAGVVYAPGLLLKCPGLYLRA